MRSSFRRRGGPICLANEEEEEEDRYLGWINHIWPSQSVIERSIRFLSMIKKIRVIYNLDNFWKVSEWKTRNRKEFERSIVMDTLDRKTKIGWSTGNGKNSMRIDANNPPIKFVLLPFPFSVSLFTSQLTGTNSHRARPNVCLFYLAIDIRVHGRRCSRAHCRKSSPRKFPRGKLASERWKWSVEKTVSRDIAGRSVGRSIVPLARRPSYRGRKATRNFVIHVSFIFYLKKIPFFSLQTKVVSFSLSLSPSQFKPTFKIFSKRRKKRAAVAAPFLLILRFPLYAFVFLSHVTSIAKK